MPTLSAPGSTPNAAGSLSPSCPEVDRERLVLAKRDASLYYAEPRPRFHFDAPLLRPLARALSATGRHREATADGYEAWLTETFAR